jgi:hypothetical protein
LTKGFICLYLSAPSRFFSRKTPEKHGKTVLCPPHRRRVRSCLRSKHKHGTTKKACGKWYLPSFISLKPLEQQDAQPIGTSAWRDLKAPHNPNSPAITTTKARQLPAGFDSTTKPPSTWYDTGAAQGSIKSRGAPLWLNRHVAALTLALHHPEDRSETGGANWHAWLRKDSSHWTFNCFPCLR